MWNNLFTFDLSNPTKKIQTPFSNDGQALISRVNLLCYLSTDQSFKTNSHFLNHPCPKGGFFITICYFLLAQKVTKKGSDPKNSPELSSYFYWFVFAYGYFVHCPICILLLRTQDAGSQAFKQFWLTDLSGRNETCNLITCAIDFWDLKDRR